MLVYQRVIPMNSPFRLASPSPPQGAKLSGKRSAKLLLAQQKVPQQSHGWPSENEGFPSGKHTKNDGKSQFFMGKSTVNGDFP